MTGPLVIAGDLNTTRYRPEFEELLEAGLLDGIDSLGKGWKPSFSLKSVWPLGSIGFIARLDQARENATGGSGLGLAITLDIIQRHGGTIAVDGTGASGASFVVSLPRTRSDILKVAT